jgi:ribosome assembly protein YihI (activator of Der GTPase)
MAIDTRLEEIRKRFDAGGALSREDAAYVLAHISKLEDINKALKQHSLELAQEMENVKSDFDPNFR